MTDQKTSNYFDAFKAGNEDALTFFYNLYATPLARYGNRFLSCRFALEEIINDAFMIGWSLKHIIESPKHLYCLVRLRVKWGCYEHLRDDSRRRTVLVDNMNVFCNHADEQVLHTKNEELREAVYRAIPLLHPTKANVMTLYFSYGLSCKQIARQYSTSSQDISSQLQKSIGFLKTVIRKKKENAAFKIVPAKQLSALSKRTEEMLRADQLILFKLRYEQRQSFDSISKKLGMSVHEVQVKYIEAHKILRSLQQHKK